jgi:hypothetical protein
MGRIHNEFDAVALFEAMDAQRVARGLNWREATNQIWDLSAGLNERRRDHPIAASTLTGIAKRRDCTCQHALFILRWLGTAPEQFVPGIRRDGSDALPFAGPDQRLRWNLKALYDALNARRVQQGLSWPEVAAVLQCTAHQLKGIRTARFAIGMKLAMRIVLWLDRPASTYVYAAEW